MPFVGSRLSINARLFIVALLVILLIAEKKVKSQTATGISPDIFIRYNCVGKANPPSDVVIEHFLSALGFQVLNKARLAREHGVPYILFQDIVAINGERQRISFREVPPQSGSRHIILNSPPPTHRSPELEEGLLSFVKDKLACEIGKVERHENGEESLGFYNDFFTLTQGWFRQAEEMRRGR